MQPSSSKYEKPLHASELVFDKKSVLLAVKKSDVDALPLPTKLTLTSFKDIKQQVLQATTDLNKKEFDILAIVVNCFPPRYLMTMNKWLQELIVMDIFKHTFTFTIWDQTIMDNEVNKVLQQLHEYPITLVHRIGGSRYNGVMLTTKFNTTILIDPPYPQRQQLQAWITENKATLTSFTLRSTSKSGSLIFIPVDEEVIPIANAESQEDGQTFSIEAKIFFPSDQKRCYVLVCSNCGQEVRYPIIMQIHCMNCNQHKMLIPRCRFDVNLEDSSGSTTGMIMNKEGEKLLSLTAEQIYERTSTKMSTQSFINKIFSIRVKKEFARASNTTASKLYIQSCVEKEYTTHPLPAPNTTNIQEGSKRKQQVKPEQGSEHAESSSVKM